MHPRVRSRELAVDPVQEIEVERCRYPLGVVICGQEHIRILEPIDADQRSWIRTDRDATAEAVDVVESGVTIGVDCEQFEWDALRRSCRVPWRVTASPSSCRCPATRPAADALQRPARSRAVLSGGLDRR